MSVITVSVPNAQRGRVYTLKELLNKAVFTQNSENFKKNTPFKINKNSKFSIRVAHIPFKVSHFYSYNPSVKILGSLFPSDRLHTSVTSIEVKDLPEGAYLAPSKDLQNKHSNKISFPEFCDAFVVLPKNYIGSLLIFRAYVGFKEFEEIGDFRKKIINKKEYKTESNINIAGPSDCVMHSLLYNGSVLPLNKEVTVNNHNDFIRLTYDTRPIHPYSRSFIVITEQTQGGAMNEYLVSIEMDAKEVSEKKISNKKVNKVLEGNTDNTIKSNDNLVFTLKDNQYKIDLRNLFNVSKLSGIDYYSFDIPLKKGVSLEYDGEKVIPCAWSHIFKEFLTKEQHQKQLTPTYTLDQLEKPLILNVPKDELVTIGVAINTKSLIHGKSVTFYRGEIISEF